MKRIKTIIFDMDGVLIDSPKYVWKGHNKILERHGANVSDDNIPKYLGRSLRDQLTLLIEDFELGPIEYEEYAKELWELQKEFFKEISDEESPKEVIKNLKEEGYKIILATSSPKRRAIEILKMLDILEYFDGMVTADDTKKHKPNPEVFLKASKKGKSSPEECVVIEDAVNGIIAANKAGAVSIALLTRYHQKEDFEDADHIINDLKELKGILKKPK